MDQKRHHQPPKKYDAREIEAKWRKDWAETGVYRFNRKVQREKTFSIDTPPPTVSGSLHVGHVFSYTHADVIARYRRMNGMNVFYPMGWDDNGLPTERRVQNYFGIQCDTSKPYAPGWQAKAGGNDGKVSRKNFIEACALLTEEDEKSFKDLWTRTGLSVDWTQEYATISQDAMIAAQYSFLDLFKKGHAYNAFLPTMWDTDFETAVAQAEIQDRPEKSSYHTLPFGIEGTDDYVTIATTRPELLCACVGVTAHPDDPRYRGLFGRKAITPIFGVEVPVFPSEEADPDKGTGILMVCTFGDAADVDWWRRENLLLIQTIGKDGRISPVTFGTGGVPSRNPSEANRAMDRLVGLTVRQARAEMVAMMDEPRVFDSVAPSFTKTPPVSTEHQVRFYENGNSPIEYISSRQWFISLLDKKEALIERGRQVRWHPDHMRLRYENWTENLAYDWCISRQRAYGVPIPVWYPLDSGGAPDYLNPILPSEMQLPVDPAVDIPQGRERSQRDVAGGFTADTDVFDTWFTSSLSPQIAGKWRSDTHMLRNVYPMDIRPQSHEIIRTWAFYTIVKSHLHEGTIPWSDVVISGWILDPDRKKMSKSKGNVITPIEYFEKYSADALRYWAASARLGTDTAFDEAVLKAGKRLSLKIFNAAKFVDFIGPAGGAVSEELDRSFLHELKVVVRNASAYLDEYQFARAFQTIEGFFWSGYTDAYIELAKTRAKESGGGADSARSALSTGLSILLRLFAPFLPFVTEECWSWWLADAAGCKSIHTSPWPTPDEISAEPVHHRSFAAAREALAAIHKAKTLAGKSAGMPVKTLTLEVPERDLPCVAAVLADIRGGGRCVEIVTAEGDEGYEVSHVEFDE